MTFLVIRVRSDRGVKPKIPDTPAYAGMLQKAKDYVTWGEIEADTIASLLKERGRMTGDKPVTDAGIKAGSEYSTIKALAKAIAAGDARTNEGLKLVFRLHPPRGTKGWGGIKRGFSIGGALGFRGEAITELVGRMI